MDGREKKYVEKHSKSGTAYKQARRSEVKSIGNMSISKSNWLESRLGKEKQ